MELKELEKYLLNLQSSNSVFKTIKGLSTTYNVYVCGGYLRNLIMGNSDNKDLDIFVDCSREELVCFVEDLSSYGNIEFGQYGSPRLYISNSDIEYIDIVPFYNFIVAGKPLLSIDDILNYFDFTANAIAWDFKDDKLLDPLNGIDDINNGFLRAVRFDFPEMPVSEDIKLSAVSVFWFRLLHYQNVLGLQFDNITERWIVENKNRMKDYDVFCQYFFVPSISPSMIAKLNSDVLRN